MPVVELDDIIVLLLDTSDLLSDDELSEVDVGVLNLEVFLLADLVVVILLDVVLNIPGHVWVLGDNLSDDLLVEVMVVLELLLDVVGDLLT